MTMWRIRRQFNRAARAAYSEPRKNRRDRPSGWSTTKPHHRKVITPEMGEYIKFEETTTTTTVDDPDNHTTTTYTSTEQQITDVEWEDIP